MSLVARIFGSRPANDEDDNKLTRALAAAAVMNDDDDEPITIVPVSLDTLERDIHQARNRLVHCQAELTRAEMALDDALRAFEEECRQRRLLHR